MKTGIILTVLSVFAWILYIGFAIKADYQYERDIQCHWNLADKASTIAEKSKHINDFVAALESQNFMNKYDAIWFKTQNNGFDENLKALKTLQERLKIIETMDESTFQYQTAIQQITEQEQGQAYGMLSVFYGVWFKEYYILLWNWICVIGVIISIVLFALGISLIIFNYD